MISVLRRIRLSSGGHEVSALPRIYAWKFCSIQFNNVFTVVFMPSAMRLGLREIANNSRSPVLRTVGQLEMGLWS